MALVPDSLFTGCNFCLELQCSLRLILPFFHPLSPLLGTDLHCGLTTLPTTSSSLLFSSHGHIIHQLSYTSNSIMEYSLWRTKHIGPQRTPVCLSASCPTLTCSLAHHLLTFLFSLPNPPRISFKKTIGIQMLTSKMAFGETQTKTTSLLKDSYIKRIIYANIW